MATKRLFMLVGIILAAALSRLVPHPGNFTPVFAIALFGGAQFSDKRMALVVPLAAMFISDLVLGLHSLMFLIYGIFILIVCMGFWLRSRRRLLPITVSVLASSVLFYVVTNFAVWVGGAMYPMTGAGLILCYEAGIPFFNHTLLSTALFSAVLFGAVALAEKRFPVLCKASPALPN